MTRDQARELLANYKNFPASNLFTLKPYNYPLFYLLECFAKDWRIEYSVGGCIEECTNLDFEKIASHQRLKHSIWRYVARNPQLNHTETTVGYVQQDLFSRYVGKCNPLKTPQTSWTYFPRSEINDEVFCFNGTFGKDIRLYQIEIDLNATNIVGKRNYNLPWHYLQYTLEWKDWTTEINWRVDEADTNDEQHPTIAQRIITHMDRVLLGI